MSESTLPVKYLKDYKAPLYKISKTELWFDLKNCITTVKSKLYIEKCGQHQEPLKLNGVNMRLIDISIDGEHPMSDFYDISDEYLTIYNPKDQFELCTTVEINPESNKALTGLYKSNSIYCTQCESHGFRHITYYLDRPDIMSVFTTTISADIDECPILLSNGDKLDAGKTHLGRHWVKWHDPHPKPSYLFALVAGSMDKVTDNFVTKSGRDVSLEIFVEQGKAKKALFALNCLKRSMKWDEDVFNREYDLDTYMIVAVNDFNFGAMENKGLNVFNDKYVLASGDSATDDDFLGVDVVIAHEYFHNWSGNRVTCRDWFQLSLKEGLTVFREQKYTEDISCPTLERIKQARIIEEFQFKEDSGPMSHPIRPSSYVDMNNFYTVTVYNKGSEVIRMLETMSSPRDFINGTDNYFAKFDGQAVTTDDFVDVMQASLNIDLKQFRLWYDQAGTPLVTIRLNNEGSAYSLSFKQTDAATQHQKIKHDLLIPIAFTIFSKSGDIVNLPELSQYQQVDGSYLLKLTGSETVLNFTSEHELTVAALNKFSAPVKLDDDLSICQRLLVAKNSKDGYQRYKQMQKVHIASIEDCLAIADASRYSNLPDLLVDAHESILLDKSIPDSLKAEILSIPVESYIMELRNGIDTDSLISVMQHFRAQLSSRLLEVYKEVYAGIELDIPYHFNSEQAGKRSLKNYCLKMMNIAGCNKSIAIAKNQYIMSDNMTEKSGALVALSANASPEFDYCLDDFYKQWSDEPLVIDKWLAIQASSTRENALDSIKQLLNHDAYDCNNPNRVRSLIGVFCQKNFAEFHRADGESYKFLVNQVINIQSFNSQLAARLISPLLYWDRFDEKRQAMMLDCLKTIANTDRIADGVMEPVRNSILRSEQLA